jgi:tartronate-semialdehyde synthase
MSRATGSIAAKPGRWAGRFRPRLACAQPTPPRRKIVALSGDYDFQFMIEELAVGAQHKLPYLHVVVNNSYLGLIRQSQRGFQMDFEVSLAFENINATPEGDAVPGYGVDHVAVAEGLGCKAIRVKNPNEFKAAFARAHELMERYQVPVVLEFILERVTNISMGAEIDGVNEFEEILCLDPKLSIKNSQDMRNAEKKPAEALEDRR